MYHLCVWPSNHTQIFLNTGFTTAELAASYIAPPSLQPLPPLHILDLYCSNLPSKESGLIAVIEASFIYFLSYLCICTSVSWSFKCLWWQHGIKAWKSARDSTGFTPEDYALARGHQSYILLLQKKINNANASEEGHVILDISGGLSAPPDVVLNQSGEYKSSELTRFNIEKSQPSCKFCAQQQLACRTSVSRSLLYRPLMLSMLGIAAVCVCVGLLFKGPPEVSLVCPPFSWESLGYGTMWGIKASAIIFRLVLHFGCSVACCWWIETWS